VPRNRRPQDRAEKQQEIVFAAAALFTDAGYDETSTAKIAAAANVTTNTIYWYFADKDALLVAVLEHILAVALADAAQQAGAPWVDQVLWAIDRLDQHRRLVTVVHARAATSASIATWHDGFHTLMDTMMTDGLRDAGIPDDDLVPLTKVGVFVVEGLLMHPHPEPDRRAIIELLVNRAAQGTGTSDPGPS
jgi:AcrR family transcriptional regulator